MVNGSQLHILCDVAFADADARALPLQTSEESLVNLISSAEVRCLRVPLEGKAGRAHPRSNWRRRTWTCGQSKSTEGLWAAAAGGGIV